MKRALLALALVACHKPPPAPAIVDAGPAAPRPLTFQVMAETSHNGELSFRRAYDGPAFVTWYGDPPLFAELAADGKITPWKHVTSDLRGHVGVVGMQPDGITGIEGETWHDSAAQQGTAWEVAGSAVSMVSGEERRVGYYPWKNGSVLVLRSSAVMTGVMGFPTIWLHTSHFEALVPTGKTAPDVPKIPETIAHADRFMAYPDGRIFILADPRRDHDGVGDVDAMAGEIYEIGGPAPPIPAPGFDATDALVPGAEMLLAKLEQPTRSAPMLARVDVAKRSVVKIDVSVPEPLRTVVRADDGEVWLVTGGDDPGVGRTYGSLYRGRIDGARLAAIKVELPNKLTPVDVVARGTGDVWVVARDSDHDPHSGKYFLLHSQSSAPATPWKVDIDRIENEAWAEKPPEKWSADCEHPLLVLGDGDIDEAKITAAAKKSSAGNPQVAERGQLGGSEVWALRLINYDPTSANAPPKLARRWQASFPQSKLFCARMLTSKRISIAAQD